ncbi:unnamed protein product (macronuclear) [Paramecium tetraurelia]|uniref:mRNA 5'-phosphatase n=1 Tax=Paramecium tetraurelia TaxID=5888 RepID=A0DB48_PARTE|nr:uncharacterized protein GSPATT00015159001 [Paramecium tetraurelia]CAK80265.1 unnamed protein product [Paramecium tetraurelia]|eukprot:XP_001447662.1 hypothetical protein (macronuclear) [Paramecium tetraurelia strain d4-2]
MNKEQLIRQISKIIKNKIVSRQGQNIFELEAKMGKFKGIGVQQNDYLESIKGMEQLDNNNLRYQFESKIDLKQYNNAYDYLKQKENQVFVKRIDFIMDKQKRNSFQIINDQVSGIQIEKQRNQKEHIDIVDNKIQFRISLNQEKILSTDLKELLDQMSTRKKYANFIRLKQTLLVKEDKFEFALSNVGSLKKYSDLEFQKILDQISASQSSNIQKNLEQIFKTQSLRDYELEIELEQVQDLNDEQILNLSKSFINQIYTLWSVINFKQNEDVSQQSEKKTKIE